LFLVGGSWRALARIDMERRKYPLHVMHEYRMSIQSVRDTIEFLNQTDHEALRVACGVSSARMALVPYAAEVLKRLLHVFRPKDIAISSYGIREGMLYEEMPQDLRERDPLIEASQYAEMKDARFPGYGDRLYQFIKNVFPATTPELDRLSRAACYLHDVSWRAHPDYRAEVCFDNATRANLGGLKHSERVFLGLALLHRYKNNRDGSPFANLFTLVKPEQIRNAEILGKAMRLGAMLWIVDPTQTAELTYNKKKKTIVLTLSEGLRPLFGEVAEARFQSLSNTLNAKPLVQFI
jgi:exopolyphosphatase/guanosine-5'-triphosphate,3'-diphosphate pyrophosphatase